MAREEGIPLKKVAVTALLESIAFCVVWVFVFPPPATGVDVVASVAINLLMSLVVGFPMFFAATVTAEWLRWRRRHPAPVLPEPTMAAVAETFRYSGRPWREAAFVVGFAGLMLVLFFLPFPAEMQGLSLVVGRWLAAIFFATVVILVPLGMRLRTFTVEIRASASRDFGSGASTRRGIESRGLSM